MKKLALSIATMVVGASSIVAASPANATTSIVVTVTPDLTPVAPGTPIHLSIEDPAGELCVDVPVGGNVGLYVNFENPDGDSVTYTYDWQDYENGGATYVWDSYIYWGSTELDGDHTTRNWTLTPVVSCWWHGDVTIPDAPTGVPLDYAPISQSVMEAAPGSDVSIRLSDATAGGWCTPVDSGNVSKDGASALVHIIAADGSDTIVPAGWTAGQAALGEWDPATSSISLPFTVPNSLAGGDYDLAVECVDSTFTTTGKWALSTLKVPLLPATGQDATGFIAAGEVTLMGMFLGATLIAIRRRKLASQS